MKLDMIDDTRSIFIIDRQTEITIEQRARVREWFRNEVKIYDGLRGVFSLCGSAYD